ncbi:hypothetical protein ACJ72_05367 [Emergomyces africanus]|uniref:Uncharacterized protein n=1 Tax=Emergomyces africanus TaxID=1955775 RepID=A0A1B7NU42_9EURO|nr:hypothetical protein ACJ72_05367 [Emergomyces africanus]
MEYSQRGSPYPLQPPNDSSQPSRISIGALLNPPRQASDSSSIPPTSPRPHDSYHYYHHQQHPHYPELPYRQSHYRSAQNLTNGRQSVEGQTTGYSDHQANAPPLQTLLRVFTQEIASHPFRVAHPQLLKGDVHHGPNMMKKKCTSYGTTASICARSGRKFVKALTPSSPIVNGEGSRASSVNTTDSSRRRTVRP